MAINQLVTTQKQLPVNGSVPALLADAGRPAVKRAVNFFTAEIENPNTRLAYGRAVLRFSRWCEARGLTLEQLEPFIIAKYVKELRPKLAKTSIKQHLAALKHFFDYLVTGAVQTVRSVGER